FILGLSIALLYLQSLSQFQNSGESSVKSLQRSWRSRKSALESDEGFFLIVIIFTAAKHADRRSTIRETWLKFGVDNHRRVKHYFVIGTAGLGVDDLERLNEEQDLARDILLLPTLKDKYERLTEKLLLTFKWVSKLHPFDYILK